jgi:hypothetical protein
MSVSVFGVQYGNQVQSLSPSVVLSYAWNSWPNYLAFQDKKTSSSYNIQRVFLKFFSPIILKATDTFVFQSKSKYGMSQRNTTASLCKEFEARFLVNFVIADYDVATLNWNNHYGLIGTNVYAVTCYSFGEDLNFSASPSPTQILNDPCNKFFSFSGVAATIYGLVFQCDGVEDGAYRGYKVNGGADGEIYFGRGDASAFVHSV